MNIIKKYLNFQKLNQKTKHVLLFSLVMSVIIGGSVLLYVNPDLMFKILVIIAALFVTSIITLVVWTWAGDMTDEYNDY